MKNIIYYIGFFWTLICLAKGKKVVSKVHGKWTHEVNLEEDNVKIKWRNSDIDAEGGRWLSMEITAQTTGYIGIGWSPHGGMDGADILIGWTDSSGLPHLMDFHGVGNGLPVLDKQQDAELIQLKQKDGWTTLTFKRKWDSCDEDDMIITDDTMRLIWAHSPNKPLVQGGQLYADWHGASNRGARSVIIADGGAYPPFPDEAPQLYKEKVKIFDMTMNKVPVEAVNTTYHCKIHKFPHTEKKHHLIGWKPILTPENKKIVHHIVVFECSVPKHEVPLFDQHSKEQGGLCYTKNMPAEWGRNCVSFMFVWVVGSEGEMFPEHVGSPLGEEHGGSTYFMFEMHYENPGLRKTVDSSGIRLFYTEDLRQHDGATILMGYRHSPFLLIPPKQQDFTIHGLCGSECTQRMIPEGGIHLTNTLVHMHLWGKKIRLRHFRNGVELPIIAEDNYYDFNYQQSRTLKNELTILPGDELITECQYNTEDADGYVLGGLATMQEMCQVFFFYYPRINLTQCTSQYEFHDFFQGFGIEGVSGEVLKTLQMPYNPMDEETDLADDARELEGFEEGTYLRSVFDLLNITNPKHLRGQTASKRMNGIEWEKPNIGENAEEFWKNGKHYSFCAKPGLRREPLNNHIIEYPKINKPLTKNKSGVCLHDASKLSKSGATTGLSVWSSLWLFPVSAFILSTM